MRRVILIATKKCAWNPLAHIKGNSITQITVPTKCLQKVFIIRFDVGHNQFYTTKIKKKKAFGDLCQLQYFKRNSWVLRERQGFVYAEWYSELKETSGFQYLTLLNK